MSKNLLHKKIHHFSSIRSDISERMNLQQQFDDDIITSHSLMSASFIKSNQSFYHNIQRIVSRTIILIKSKKAHKTCILKKSIKNFCY